MTGLGIEVKLIVKHRGDAQDHQCNQRDVKGNIASHQGISEPTRRQMPTNSNSISGSAMAAQQGSVISCLCRK